MHIQYFITLMNKHIQQFITSNTGMFLFNYNLTCFFKTILIYDLSFLVLIMCKIYGAENNFMIVGSNDPHISYIRSVLRNVCGEHVVCIWYECSLSSTFKLHQCWPPCDLWPPAEGTMFHKHILFYAVHSLCMHERQLPVPIRGMYTHFSVLRWSGAL